MSWILFDNRRDWKYKIKDRVMDIQVLNEIIIRIDSRFSNRNCNHRDYDSMLSVQETT